MKIKTFEEGFKVCITVEEGAAPRQTYIGIVTKLDDLGVRLTLLNRVMRSFIAEDMFIA